MGATADTIWQIPAYLPYVQPPLTEEIVASAEKEIGYKLPTAYLNLLKTQNGGYIRFVLPEMVHRSIAGIGPHYRSLTRFDLDDCQEQVSYPLQGLVPFDGDGHWFLCLDYRRDPDTPAVTYADIELDRESRVADTFADYLALLQLDIGDELVLDGIADIEAVKSDLSRVLGVVFDPPEAWAHGYPEHRARFASTNEPEWLWLAPNLVPRGFVRPDHSRHDELRDLLPGDAPRCPELPADSYLLDATPGVRSQVIEACARCGRIDRPLRDYVMTT